MRYGGSWNSRPPEFGQPRFGGYSLVEVSCSLLDDTWGCLERIVGAVGRGVPGLSRATWGVGPAETNSPSSPKEVLSIVIP